MSFEAFKDSLGEYARDIKLNLSTVLSEEGAPGLTRKQIYGVALASAYATRHRELAQKLMEHASDVLDESELKAAKAAATVMAMNNVYYRFGHLVADKEFEKMPARLRMNVIASPGVAKADFELFSLAVSAINACGKCMDAHVQEVLRGGVTKTGVHSAIRIAAVIAATAQAASIGEFASETQARQVA